MIQLDLKKRESLLTKVESYTEIPMLILVVVMIATLVVPLVVELDEDTHHLFELIDWFIWAAFALELAVKTYLSPKRLIYLRTHWLDVLIVALPLLRVFRVFRAARLARGARLARSSRVLRLLRFARILVFFGRFTQELKAILSHRGFHYLLLIFIGLIGLGTLLSYSFDKNLTSGATDLPQSLWLTVVAAFSGGFANVYPESPEAKAVSVLLIMVGTVIVSYFTASLASYFTEKGQDVEQTRIEKKLDQLLQEVTELKKDLPKIH